MSTIRNLAELAFRPSQLAIARYSTRVAAEQVMADYPDAIAVTAGPMFKGGANTRFRLLDKGAGLDEASDEPRNGATISVVDDRATMAMHDAISPGATVAVQGYPTLVIAGTNVASGQSLTSVSGLGILRDGRLLVLLGSAGTLHDLAEAFLARGATNAVYLDAGSSAALLSRSQGYLGVHAAHVRIPTWLVVLKPGAAHGRDTGLPDALVTGGRVAGGMAAAYGGYRLVRWLLGV